MFEPMARRIRRARHLRHRELHLDHVQSELVRSTERTQQDLAVSRSTEAQQQLIGCTERLHALAFHQGVLDLDADCLEQVQLPRQRRGIRARGIASRG